MKNLSQNLKAALVVVLSTWPTLALSQNIAFLAKPKFAHDRVIVRFKSGLTQTQMKKTLGLSSGMSLAAPLIPEMNIYLVTLDQTQNVGSALLELMVKKDVLYSQLDHEVKMRTKTPNDPEFPKQWSLAGINSLLPIRADQAWEISTGGKDRKGRDVVVAVVDGGVDTTHPDLIPNLWVNSGEIPGNGIDDDQNGYVDDVNGWNAYLNNNKIPANFHGTHVAGIMGAKGNNGQAVTGLNWDLKIMSVAGSSGTTSTVVAAYGYVLKMKKLWLETKGTKGANIVATNSSFGVDNADCTSGEFPVWNDLYNQMGAVGILSAAATANNAVDVDATGDVPTGCGSPFLVTVTNTTLADAKYEEAGWGKTTIDLGAPGTDILSTLPGGAVGPLTGTSMATPHVAGAIGLLTAAASEAFLGFSESNPGDAALALKQILMTTVDVLPSLKDVTVSGGRLNVGAAAQAISNYSLTPQ